MAHTTLFMLLSSVLHAYWISAPTDKNGNRIPVNIRMTHGVVSYVLFYFEVFSWSLIYRKVC